MSTPPPPPAPGAMRCPRCDATIGPEQDWCLACGAPARTRLAPTPNWRAPVLLVAVVVALSGVALGFAFVALTGEDDEVTPANTVSVVTTTPTGTTNPALPPTTPTTPVPTPPPAAAATPTTTVPPATTTPPTVPTTATTPTVPTTP